MNYITEILAFYDWLETNSIATSSIVLWHALMSIANKTRWQTEFSVAISILTIKTGLKKDAIENARLQLAQKGRIEFKSRSGNQSAVYKIISFVEFKPPQDTAQTPSQYTTQDTAQTPSQPTAINKLNETKQNKINIKNISLLDLRQRYTTEQLEIIDKFFDVLKHTRASAKIADSVICGIYEKWDKHNPTKVIYALHKYIHSPNLHDKKENYVLGIINNATMADIEKYKNQLLPESEKQSQLKQQKQFKTAYERTLDTARESLEKYRNGESMKIDI